MLTIRGVLQGLEHFGWDLAVAIADRGLLLAFGLWALWSGSGLRGLTLAFVVARGVALALAAALTHVRLGGVGVRYDRTSGTISQDRAAARIFPDRPEFVFVRGFGDARLDA